MVQLHVHSILIAERSGAYIILDPNSPCIQSDGTLHKLFFLPLLLFINCNNNCMVRHIFMSAWKVFMSSIILLQPFLATCANTGVNNNIGVHVVTRYYAHRLRNLTRECLY